MIAGVSITTLLLVLAAGIGAGFVGYAVGASSLISYPAFGVRHSACAVQHHEHGGRVRYGHRRTAFRPQGA